MINLYNEEQYGAVIKRAVNGVFEHFNIASDDAEVEIELISEEEIRELNREEREIDAVTDVLSFPTLNVKLPFNYDDYPMDVNPESGAVMLGEIYVCLKRAEEQAVEYGHSITREIGFLVTHGMLHLLGYDHIDDVEREKMELLQSEILEKVGITRDVQDGDIVEEVEEDVPFKCGYCAILGKPNAGKSTLINALVGEKVAIVSWKPQTTRNKITGVRNEKNAQIIFVDTPGLHAPKNKLGKFMMRSVTSALEGVDVVIYVIDSEKGADNVDIENIERYVGVGKSVVVAVNKVDHVTKEKVAGILLQLTAVKGLKAVVPISALREKNVSVLCEEVLKLLPEGVMLYPEDQYTDRNMRFMASEIIREKALRLIDKEIPYGIAVSVNKYEYRDNGILDIDADVIVQKQAHKPIVLGKNGAMIKKISTYARQDLEDITGTKVFLTLWVRVKEDWRDDLTILNNLGYNNDDF